MDEEELQKRNTDCVYFLASPLTCKKGIECEYRHSEIARLNPRDCWFWLAGSCLNPTCAFRHPPLEGRTEASSESASLHSVSTVSVNKTNVPCYFYFNGFCNKGDRCTFLHGPDDGAPALKSLKTASAVTDALPGPNDNASDCISLKTASAVTGALPFEKKTSIGSDTTSAPIETHPISYKTAPKRAAELLVKPKEDLPRSAPNNVAEESPPHISASECEEAAAVVPDPLLPAEGFIQSRSIVCTDQSSEEPVDGHVEREEWLESSPGFDVLVDGRSENLGYEDDPEYLPALDREGRELSSRFFVYDYEDPVEYNPTYPDAGILYEQEMRDSYGHLDNEHTYDYVGKPGRSREKMVDHNLPRKRKSMQMELAFDGRDRIDLRDHLKKCRVIDGHYVSHFSRRHNSSRLIGRSRERPRRQGMRQLHGRLMLDVENKIVGSRCENETLLNGANQQGRLRRSHMNRTRQLFKEKRQSKQQFLSSGVSKRQSKQPFLSSEISRRQSKQQFLSSEISRKPASHKRRSTEESTMFSGPKTLAQIKEEKMKSQENGVSFGEMGHHSSRATSQDFQGPKPLSEILKDKRRLGSVMDDNNDSS